MIDELKRVTPRRSQYQPGDEIPERSFVYRWAKKYAFNDFGSYSRHFDVSNYRDPDASDRSEARFGEQGAAVGESADHAGDLPIVTR